MFVPFLNSFPLSGSDQTNPNYSQFLSSHVNKVGVLFEKFHSFEISEGKNQGKMPEGKSSPHVSFVCKIVCCDRVTSVPVQWTGVQSCLIFRVLFLFTILHNPDVIKICVIMVKCRSFN
jgi:hypothetical protein